MRRLAVMVAAVSALVAAAVIPSVCATSSALASVAPRVDYNTLVVKGANGKSYTYTMSDLEEKFPAYVGYAGYVKTGFVGMQAPRPVKGVLLTTLLKKVGWDSRTKVTIAAYDQYSLVLSAKGVKGKATTVYQAQPPKYPVVKTMPANNPLSVIVSYQQKTAAGATTADSNPWVDYDTPATAGTDAQGPFRLWYAYPKAADPGFVTIGAGCERMVTSITVGGTGTSSWKVRVVGPASTFVLTTAQYKLWAGRKTDGAQSVKVSGHTYTGLPLAVIVGMVDGSTTGTFNSALAQKGYTIAVGNGKQTVKVDSKAMAQHAKTILLAWKKDGSLLSGSKAPLWLIGTGLASARTISGIQTITLSGVPQ